jgi:hypothetical protein
MSGTVIKLKYSEVNAQPADDSLSHAEPAYSYQSGRLWIGKFIDDGTGNGTGAIVPRQIGGEYFTGLLDHTGGTNQALVDNTVSALLTDTEGYVDELLAEALTIGTSGGAGIRITSIVTNLDSAVSNVQLVTAGAVKSYVDSQLGSTSLTDLDDVTLGTLADANVLMYQAGTGQWVNRAFTGDVTINASGVTDITATTVTAGSYGSATAIPTFTVAADGRITAASTVSVATVLSVQGDDETPTSVDLLTDTFTVAGGVGLTSSTSADRVTIRLDDTTVTAGVYGDASNVPTFEVDAQGRIIAAGTVSIATSLDISGGTGTADSGSDTVNLLEDTLTFTGGTGLTATISNNDVKFDLDDTGVTNGTYGSATQVPTLEIDSQGRITSVSTSFVSTNVTVGGDTGSGNITTESQLTIAGGTALTTAFSAGTLTIDLDDVPDLVAQQYGSATLIPQFSVDAQGRITAIGTVSVNANSFGTVQVTDTDTGFSWAETGSAISTANAATLKIVSGTGVNVNVDSASDAIRIENSGVVTLAGTNHLSVSNVGTDYTVTSDGTSANTASTLVARDANGDFSAGTITANGIQVDDLNINGNVISTTTVDQNIQLSPDGDGIVEITSDANITGSLTITGDLTVSGTSTQINVTELVVQDPIIYLASATSGTESTTDIGFVANVVNAGVYSHSGLVRHKADGIWYLFDDYTEEVDDNGNVIDPTHESFNLGSLNANVIGALQGVAETATKLLTARSIELTGAVAGSVSFDGSANVLISTTAQADSVELGTHTTGNYVATIATENGGLIVNNSGTETAAVTIELDVTDTLFVEGAQDAVGAMLVGTYTNISISYDDANNLINASVPTASTSVKGVASFSADNFAVNSGVVTITVIDGGTF